MEPIKYSAYAEECCRVLEQANEYPHDQHLVNLMRVMRMIGRIRSTLDPEEFELSTGMTAPVGACVKSLATELEELKTTLPSGTYLAGKYLYPNLFRI